MIRPRNLARRLAVVAALVIVGAGSFAAPASAAPVFQGGCTAPTLGSEVPPTTARATCWANMDAVALLSGSCGSSGTFDFERIHGGGIAFLNIECYNYGRISNVAASVSPVYSA
jgi:hypothetical protein